MATTNKGLEQPALNSTNWNTPLNLNFGYIDAALGGVTTKSVTGVGTTPVTLTLAEYQNLILNFTGVLTANVIYQVPSGVGGQWIVTNNTTGSFTLTIRTAAAGASVAVPTGASRVIYSDGTNVMLADNSVTAIGSANTVIYNNGSQLTGNSKFTYDGTKVSVQTDSATTNAAVDILSLNAQSTGTPAAGFGPQISFSAETTPSTTKVGLLLSTSITDVSAGSEDFDFVVKLMAAGAAAAEKFRVTSVGEAVSPVVKGTTAVQSPLYQDASGGNTAQINGGLVNVSDEQIFTASGTWTKPANYPASAIVVIEAWGGGGGGARDGGTPFGAGGGGGGYMTRTMRLSDLSSTVAVTVGAGGIGKVSGVGNGAAGGNSTFGSYLTAYGGGGGQGGATANAGGGGGGELSAGGVGTAGRIGGGDPAITKAYAGYAQSIYGGGAGGAGAGGTPANGAGGNAVYGGGGGGGGVSGSVGTTGGTSLFGGAGGTGGDGTPAPTAGTAPGGGGGGGDGVDGMDGARGEVRVRVYA